MDHFDKKGKEDGFFDQKASRSSLAKRVYDEPDCEIRNKFQVDRDRIIHSKAFRRLEHKTQVYIHPEKDHYRTRLTHTLEVSQIARTIARALALNEDLTEAIALGHDLGHTPYGHMGERVLNDLHPNGFKHNEQSLRIVEYLEGRHDYPGLNLTGEVRDGIVNHSSQGKPKTLEGKIVQISDRIAYINHDLDDAKRCYLLQEEDIPSSVHQILGKNHSERIDTLVRSVIRSSKDLKEITMEKDIYREMMNLRTFLFQNVYQKVSEKGEMERVYHVLETLYHYFKKNMEKIPKSHLEIYDKFNSPVNSDDIITDYIAGMTDIYAKNIYEEIFIPKSWSI
ncbi:MAG: deoxyguanosinetriphosphate triphosphohydrolase [Tissierellia bacterium]|nr:deoxyguanosinetriphosphate triphosphohydrolase [Tissierellia bacterium]